MCGSLYVSLCRNLVKQSIFIFQRILAKEKIAKLLCRCAWWCLFSFLCARGLES